MKIIDLYKKYNIMSCLQVHQMRVAAVAWAICDSLSVNINRDSVVTACLLHDMGNIIKFKLDQFPEWSQPEGLEYWENIKHNYISRYGDNEHEASLKIAKELGISDEILKFINCVDASSVGVVCEGHDFGKKICLYADNRVAPFGIVSIEERILEAKERYKNHNKAFNEEKRKFFKENMNKIEKQIFSSSNIKPQDINDNEIKIYLEKLIDFSM